MFVTKLYDMKQLISKRTYIIAFICVLCMSCFLLKEERHKFSDLTFSNIEALASGESGGAGCAGSGSLYCNGGYYKYQYYSLK